jgi:hypothetical protein
MTSGVRRLTRGGLLVGGEGLLRVVLSSIGSDRL